MIRNRFLLETRAEPDGSNVQDLARFRAELDELPVPNNALDAVVLHHVLETAQDPRKSIREVSRVLAPGGRLLIISFNPWSLWGLRSAYARLFRDHFSGMRFVSTRRLLDWLTVLGFELQQEVKYVAYSLPYSTRKADAGFWRRTRGWLSDAGIPIGGVFVMSAVKQAAAIRPDWSESAMRGRKLAPAAYPKLSARVAELPMRGKQPDGIEDAG